MTIVAMPISKVSFDYAALPEGGRELRTAAKCIRRRLERSVEDIMAIGKDLATQKLALDHGPDARADVLALLYTFSQDTNHQPIQCAALRRAIQQLGTNAPDPRCGGEHSSNIPTAIARFLKEAIASLIVQVVAGIGRDLGVTGDGLVAVLEALADDEGNAALPAGDLRKGQDPAARAPGTDAERC